MKRRVPLAAIVRAYKQGHSIRTIARRGGVSYYAVRSALLATNTPIRPVAWREHGDRDRARMIRLLAEQGLTKTEIAARLACSKQLVAYHLRNHEHAHDYLRA